MTRALALALLACTALPALPGVALAAGGVEALGAYERQAVEEALAARSLEVDPTPEGKVVGRIHVVNLDVFSEGEGPLTFFNLFHVTTREHVIAREVLLRPGDPWNQEKVDETERNLRDPVFSTLVVALPVKSAEEGKVDLLVVTRDVWSLRLNSRFEVQEDLLTSLSLSIAENNFLGLRKHLSVVFDMDLGAFAIGPRYLDPNIAGTRLRLFHDSRIIFNRENGDAEGSTSFTALEYPLWSLDRQWAWRVQLRHSNAVGRVFGQDGNLVPYDVAATAAEEMIPWEFRIRFFETVAWATHRIGHRIKQQISLGHRFRVLRPEVVESFPFPGDDALAQQFLCEVTSRSERSSALLAEYRVFEPRYIVYRNIDTYDFAEDRRLGVTIEADLGAGLSLLGSETDHVFGSAGAGYTLDLGGDAFASAGASVGTRYQLEPLPHCPEDEDFIDTRASGVFFVASPKIGRIFRVVTGARVDTRLSASDRPLFLGGDNGLRGYPINIFRGRSRAVANLELRTMAVKVWFMRLGAVLFYDVGHAAPTLGDLVLHHNVGAGIRFVLPQAAPYVWRLDWAVPFQAVPGAQPAGLSGSRIVLGFEQVF